MDNVQVPWYPAVFLLLLAAAVVLVCRQRSRRVRIDRPPGTTAPAGDAQQVCGLAHFDGNGGGLDVPPVVTRDWGPGQSFSIDCRLQTAARIRLAPAQVVIGQDEWAGDSGSGMHWWVGLWGTDSPGRGCPGRAAFVLRDRDGNTAVLTGKKRLDDRRWHSLRAVHDAAAGRVSLYVDGRLAASAAAVFPAGFASTLSPLNVGWLNHAMHGGKNNYYRFRGSVDQVCVRTGL